MVSFNKTLYHKTPTVIQWQTVHPTVHNSNRKWNLTLCEILNVSLENYKPSSWECHSVTQREATLSRLKLRLCCTWEKIKVITYKIVTLCWLVACRAVKWSDFSLEFDFGFLLWNDDHGTILRLCSTNRTQKHIKHFLIHSCSLKVSWTSLHE